MSAKNQNPALIQEEYDNELAQHDSLVKQSETQKKDLLNIDKRRKALQNLCETIRIAKDKLTEQLLSLSNDEEQRRKESKDKYEQSLKMFQDLIEKSRIPLNVERSQYEMVNERLKYLTNIWDERKAQITNHIAELNYANQTYRSKIQKMKDHNEHLKSLLKRKYPNLRLDDDSGENTMNVVFTKQLHYQQEAREKQEQKDELERKCRELKRKRDLLKKNAEIVD